MKTAYVRNIGGAWSVSFGSERAYRIFSTKQEALAYAKANSKNVID